MNKTQTIVIAGGSGMIGSSLAKKWRNDGHRVRVLTRKESDPSKGKFHWDPVKKEIDNRAFEAVTVVVNLAGAGIADRRWTQKRREELLDSRVKTTEFLFETCKDLAGLEQYISASGITCYGYENPERRHPETDPYGSDTLSVIVKKWEAAADLFDKHCVVSKVRTSVVLSPNDGALKTIAMPIKMGFGSPLGKGTQHVPWIHIKDLVGIYNHLMVNSLPGAYNANAGNTTNKELTKTIAAVLKKPLWLPKVPAGILRFFMGEMADVVLESLQADNKLIKETGYKFRFTNLHTALTDLYKKGK